MRLKDKQTEEVGDYTIVNRVGEHCVGVAKDGDIKKRIKKLKAEIEDIKQAYYDIYETQGIVDGSLIWGMLQREDEIEKLERKLKK